MTRPSLGFFCFASLLIVSSAAARAQLIDVNFTNGSTFYSGAGAIGASGDTWNNINSGALNFTTSSSNDNAYNGTTSGTAASLVDSTGTASGASLTTAGFVSFNNGYPSDGDFAKNLFTGVLAAEGTDATDTNPAVPTSATLSFANLLHDTTYELELYTTNYPGGLGRSVTFSADTSATALDYASSTSFDPNQNYVTIEGTTDGSGNLVITATAASANNSNGSNYQEGYIEVAGVQLLALPSVPEPSAWDMLILGMGSLAVCIRRRVT